MSVVIDTAARGFVYTSTLYLVQHYVVMDKTVRWVQLTYQWYNSKYI